MLVPNYGLTEAMMTICTLPAEEMLSGDTPRQSMLGRAYTHVDIELRDQQGRAVADGEVGELYVRGEQVMQGYWRAPEKTAEVLCDGWLRTGDLARRSADGLFTLAGRSKEMLICGGFNIYPQEVAAVIASCPGVAEVAVVGLPDPNWGEIPVAFVAGTKLQQQALLAYSRPLLGIRTPKRWELRQHLPRTLTGKIDLAALRAELKNLKRESRR
jgi:acyl-CoA synthetase (AMP-forming)/AMP-acid ligase II